MMSFVLKVATSLLKSGWCIEPLDPCLEIAEEGLGVRGSGIVFMKSDSVRRRLGGVGDDTIAAILDSCGVEVDLVTCLEGCILELGDKERM